MRATTPRAARASAFPTRSRFSCSGVRSSWIVCNIRAMAPNSVRIPVATTSPWPRPYVTTVPA